MGSSLLVVDVGLDSRLAGSEAVYTYRGREGVGVGEAFVVPLGGRRSVGYVLGVREVTEGELGFPFSRLRDLGERVRGLDIPGVTVELVQEVSRQTLTPLAMCLSPATPPGIRERLFTRWERTDEPETEGLSSTMREVLTIVEEEPVVEGKGKSIPRGTKTSLRALAKRGLVRGVPFLQPFREQNRFAGMLRLTSDGARVERFLAGEGKKKPAQAVTVMRLQGAEDASFSAQEIKALGQVSDATVKALVSAGLLETVDAAEVEKPKIPMPNADQAAAIEAVGSAVRGRLAEKFLLYGVTGSGKTEVYLRCAEEALRAGRQVLYLVPEIALTAQVVAQLRARFGHQVAVIHSNLAPSERMAHWMRIRNGEAPVVLGARSALFAPLSNLGLIVMDEEHEASYKQESAPRYLSKRVAFWLAERHGCPLVLGSATPSIESFQQAEDGVLRRLDLPGRAAAKAKLPEVFIEDLRSIYKEKRATIFSDRLHAFLGETLGRGEQAILFLNRRAYAPFVVCRDCGHKFECPRCAVSLSFHRRDKKLRCHHCDHQIPAPEVCPECEGSRVGSFGIGAEKVEEAVAELFPEARVARLDRDVARKKGALEEVLAKFRSGEFNVLVGTQMVAKGLDFPNVTLVGVIAADISLNVPDFRASERTFQLLTQVAGRAGRGERPGRVVVQTLSPGHASVVAAQTHDYLSLFKVLVEERRAAGYPPFLRLVNVLVTGADRGEVGVVSGVLGDRLRRQLAGVVVLGPVDCAIERLQGVWRRHLVLKVPEGADLGRVASVVEGVEKGKVRVVVDVDAYQLG